VARGARRWHAAPVTLVWAALALVAQVLLGVLAGGLRLFPEPEAAIDHLNRYALYIAFPALVCAGLLSSELALPTTPGFWLSVPLVLAVTALAARAALPRQAPTIALILAFGNVAYLGLPVVEQVLGREALPIASLSVAVHVLLALSIGPALLLRWGGSDRPLRAVLGRVARQPLLWAPLVGLAARPLPAQALEAMDAVLTPLGRSAAPVALFLLGLYLYVNRARMRQVDGGDVAHVMFKVVLMPALTFGLVWALAQAGWLGSLEARVLAILSAMPAAITTFAIARDLDVGAERASRAVVSTTLASALTIPLTVWASLRWLG
jgi:malonate transporter and related proteins